MSENKKKWLTVFSVLFAIIAIILCAFLDVNISLDPNKQAIIAAIQSIFIWAALYKAFCQIWR